MDAAEARQLAEKSLPRFEAAGLPSIQAAHIKSVQVRSVARLWGGMGYVYELTINSMVEAPTKIMAKRIKMPANCNDIGDLRKKKSYDVEAAFYMNGHAERLIEGGCTVPFPLHVERGSEGGLTMLFTLLDGDHAHMDAAHCRAMMSSLAKFHALYWGKRADEASASTPKGGLQQQGGFWYLDTRPDEFASMPRAGWEGRLRLAAKGIDQRLKADPMQTVCHGDAKNANILFASGEEPLVPLMYDFQYCGKAPPTKDLAYFLTCGSEAPDKEDDLLEVYHAELSRLLECQGDTPPSIEMLRSSLALGFCDLGRWMSGWGWWGNPIKDKIKAVLDRLDGGKILKSEQEYLDAIGREFPIA